MLYKLNEFCNGITAPVKVWVLAPYVNTGDDNLNYYYDFSQSIQEYSNTFAAMRIEWQWQPVTTEDYVEIIERIVTEKKAGLYFPIVFNICDGDEINGTPGVSVVKLLESKGLIYTGADSFFYNITTSKIPMKKAFDYAHVSTAPWQAIHHNEQNIERIFERLGSPIILKPAVSGGSMGVGIKNVVHSEAELKEQMNKMFSGYRGWNLASDGLIAEAFVQGEEYTTLIVGSYNNPSAATIYMPVERIFHASLPDTEKFLSFDRLWEIYEDESAMPNDDNFYEYALPESSLIAAIKNLSWEAFMATKGTGYSRVDIRRDKNTGRLFVLEVNAQCGISEDEDYTSIGAILRLSNATFVQLITEIITHALTRNNILRVENTSIKKIA